MPVQNAVKGIKGFTSIPVEERFWAKVDQNGSIPSHCPDLGPCWEWIAAKRWGGYGVFLMNRRCQPAHRVAYTLLVGDIAEGLELDHLCRNPGCVNPSHLEPVSHKVNALRGISPAANAARQSACIWGHPFDLMNTHYRRDGRRVCRVCVRNHNREYQVRRREMMKTLGGIIELMGHPT